MELEFQLYGSHQRETRIQFRYHCHSNILRLVREFCQARWCKTGSRSCQFIVLCTCNDWALKTVTSEAIISTIWEALAGLRKWRSVSQATFFFQSAGCKLYSPLQSSGKRQSFRNCSTSPSGVSRRVECASWICFAEYKDRIGLFFERNDSCIEDVHSIGGRNFNLWNDRKSFSAKSYEWYTSRAFRRKPAIKCARC